MKIAYFGYDPLASCVEVFAAQDHQIVVIYTGKSGEHSSQLIDYAQQHGIALCFTKPSMQQMQALVEQGVELFFCAEYPWKVPLPANLPYGVNVHPTMLPEGRGPTPLPILILRESRCAGISLHKLSDEFDGGDILLQQSLVLDDNESFDSLSHKLYEQTPKLLDTLLANLKHYYSHSQPQQAGSDWPKVTQSEQSIDWRQSTLELLKQIRAFGSLGTFATIGDKNCVITAATGHTAPHNQGAGDLLGVNEQEIQVHTGDGWLNIPLSAVYPDLRGQ